MPAIRINEIFPEQDQMPIAKIILSALLTLFLSASPVLAEAVLAETTTQNIVTLEGREVILNEDGSWKYRSGDRYASTKDGDRILLKEDGSWNTVGNAPLTSNEQVRTAELDIKLQKVIIETYRKKIQKNTSLKTQTVFYVQLDYSPQSDKDLSINNSDIALVKVKDNNGKDYRVLSINPVHAQLKPETKITLVIRAEKSPLLWDRVKSMTITFKAGMLDLETPISLSQKTADFDKENVSGFK